jgi:hypothetical protein
MTVDRRTLLQGAGATALAMTLPGTALAKMPRGPNLVPTKPGSAPNYYSTWAVQNWKFFLGAELVDTPKFLNPQANRMVEDQLNEANLFGPTGWASRFYKTIRSDLLLVLDEGWQEGKYTNFELDRKKFPSFRGTPLDQIKRVNREVKALGWAGTGLWCRGTLGGDADVTAIQRMKDAGIRYCKLDQGDNELNFIRVRDRLKAPLTIEHVLIEAPLNGEWAKDGRFRMNERYPAWSETIDTTYPRGNVLDGTDVYRIYDLTSFLGLPTALDRVSQMLAHVAGRPAIKTLLNVEDEVYVAATLGCTMGVMRHPETRGRPDGILDFTDNSPRNIKRRMDEVVRALRWQRIAPPYPGGGSSITISDEVLTDSWQHGAFETWYYKAYRKLVHQGAPAAIARDMPLPQVQASAEKPFVFASRFPNGAVAVGAQQRTLVDRAWFMPEATVEIEVGRTDVPIGIFGDFSELTLKFDRPVGHVRVFGQDLMSDRSVEITRDVKIGRNAITLSGMVIDRVGRMAATPGDLSSPGLVLKILAA